MKNVIRTAASKSAGSLFIKVAIVLSAAIGGTSLVSSSVFASLTATTFNTTPQSVSTGTLSLVETSVVTVGITGGVVTAISSMAPGDTVNRYIDLNNLGTLDETNTVLQLTAASATTLDSDTVKGLQITIRECSVAWTNTGTCSGANTVVLASTPAATLKASARVLTLASTLAGRVARLQIAIALPTGSEVTTNGVLPGGTVQGLSTSLTWTFTEDQRLATTTHS